MEDTLLVVDWDGVLRRSPKDLLKYLRILGHKTRRSARIVSFDVHGLTTGSKEKDARIQMVLKLFKIRYHCHFDRAAKLLAMKEVLTKRLNKTDGTHRFVTIVTQSNDTFKDIIDSRWARNLGFVRVKTTLAICLKYPPVYTPPLPGAFKAFESRYRKHFDEVAY